eukprot:jgi/Botrbrau1/9860/Bobra.0313s0029.1
MAPYARPYLKSTFSTTCHSKPHLKTTLPTAFPSRPHLKTHNRNIAIPNRTLNPYAQHANPDRTLKPYAQYAIPDLCAPPHHPQCAMEIPPQNHSMHNMPSQDAPRN